MEKVDSECTCVAEDCETDVVPYTQEQIWKREKKMVWKSIGWNGI